MDNSKKNTKPVEVVEQATDRDNWLTAEEAVEFGLIDKVLEKKA